MAKKLVENLILFAGDGEEIAHDLIKDVQVLMGTISEQSEEEKCQHKIINERTVQGIVACVISAIGVWLDEILWLANSTLCHTDYFF